MVVCKCRKATRLYCFVHKVPVCGECVSFPEHQICVVKKYSDWVVDGEYDWPPMCSVCNTTLEAGNETQTTRLGCLHVMHTSCLVSHIRNFPAQTAPAEYVCPACASAIWPPKSIKDTGSRLHSKLKEAIIQSGLEKNVFGNHMISMSTVESRAPPPAFASDPLIHVSSVEDSEKNGTNTYDSIKDLSKEEYPNQVYSSAMSKLSEPDIIEVDGPNPIGNQFISDQDPNFMKNASHAVPGASTRKGTYHVDRQHYDMSYHADDEDGTHKKYTRRGPIRHKFLRFLLPFWSSALPTLPVTAPPRKDGASNDVPEGRMRHQRSSKMDPRKILLTMAIMACMATMGILYYRLAQSSLNEQLHQDEPQ